MSTELTDDQLAQARDLFAHCGPENTLVMPPEKRAGYALLALIDHQAAEIARLQAEAANNYNDEFFALRDALRDWPKLPPGHVLKWLHYRFPGDWERGVEMQRELDLSVIPPKTECEGGAGMWDRITEGKWRAALTEIAK